MNICYLCKKQVRQSRHRDMLVHVHCLNELRGELRWLRQQTIRHDMQGNKFQITDKDVSVVRYLRTNKSSDRVN